MPEGDTIHTLARYLEPRFVGQTPGPPTRVVSPETFALVGAKILAVRVHGKHLFIDTDRADTLRVHLGMHGSWHHYTTGERWKRPEGLARVLITIGADEYVCFRPSVAELHRTARLASHPVVGALGPDLVDIGSKVAPLDGVLSRAHRRAPESPTAGELLLDQRAASGIGNVYKSEVLFVEQVHPWQPSQSLDASTLERLYRLAATLLSRNIFGGPRVTTFDSTARTRRRGESLLWVYGRGGRPCARCQTPISRELQGVHARVTYWCASCQPLV